VDLILSAAVVVDLAASVGVLLLGLALASILASAVYGAALMSPQDGTEAWRDGLWLLLPALLPVAAFAYCNHVRPHASGAEVSACSSSASERR